MPVGAHGLRLMGGYHERPWASLGYRHRLRDGMSTAVTGGVTMRDKAMAPWVFGGLRWDW